MATAQLGTLLRHIHKLAAGRCLGGRTDRQLLDAFVSRRDEAAFATLVSHHGPRVLRVCHRVLNHEQDAEDAFQATFLVLAGNAKSIRKRDTIGSWLHGVAYRTAMKAKRGAARRRNHEARLRTIVPQTTGSPTWDDVQAVLEEEVQRLPQRFREAFVLCILEGKSGTETAAELGCKEGTVKSRVSRARRLLQEQLARRGIQLTAVLAALSVAESAGRAALSVTLAQGAVRCGLSVAAGEPAGAVIPSHIAALAAGVTRAMFLTKAKVAVVCLLAAGLIATGAGVLAHHAAFASPAGAAQAIAPAVRPADKPAKAASDKVASRKDDKESVEVRGRVLDPDGKPVRGAKLLVLHGWGDRKIPRKVWGTSAADGRFEFLVPRQKAYDEELETRWEDAHVMAAAKGHGCAVARLGGPQTTGDLVLHLTKDVPIRGRVLDLQARPVPGVRVRVNDFEPLNTPHLYLPRNGDLTAWLAALKANKKEPWDLERTHLTGLCSPAWDLLIPPVTTDTDGRFELRGIGPERVVHLRLEGPSIATEIINVMTRPSERIRLPLSRRYPRGQTITYHGAAFEIVAGPTRPIVGVVRDRDTGKPLAGVTIEPNKITNPFGLSNYNAGLIRTVTDKEGRYRLVGLPKGEDNQLMATTDDLPYLPASRTVENAPGLEPVTVDFALKRGIWVKGRVTEKTTGKPLQGGVTYYCFNDNPHKNEIPVPPFFHGIGVATREDGSFQIVVPPGRGVIAVQVHHNDRYLGGVGVEKIHCRRFNMGSIECLETHPFCQIWNRTALVEISPEPGDAAITCDLVALPIDGRKVKGTVLGPDGKPLAGATWGWQGEKLRGSDFTVKNLKPNKTRLLHFVHEGKKLAGFLTLQGDEKSPVQVRLQAWGTVTGRVLTEQGDPLTGVAVGVRSMSHWASDAPPDVLPDKNGRFRIEGLVPGWKYEGLSVAKEGLSLRITTGNPKDLTVRPGEGKDLGDVKVKTME